MAQFTGRPAITQQLEELLPGHAPHVYAAAVNRAALEFGNNGNAGNHPDALLNRAIDFLLDDQMDNIIVIPDEEMLPARPLAPPPLVVQRGPQPLAAPPLVIQPGPRPLAAPPLVIQSKAQPNGLPMSGEIRPAFPIPQSCKNSHLPQVPEGAVAAGTQGDGVRVEQKTFSAEEKLKFLVECFSGVREDWLRQQANKPQDLNEIAEFVAANLQTAPKKPRPPRILAPGFGSGPGLGSGPSSGPSQIFSDDEEENISFDEKILAIAAAEEKLAKSIYFKSWAEVDENVEIFLRPEKWANAPMSKSNGAYVAWAELYLRNEFRAIKIRNLNVLLWEHFGGYLAPCLMLLRDAMKDRGLKESRYAKDSVSKRIRLETGVPAGCVTVRGQLPNVAEIYELTMKWISAPRGAILAPRGAKQAKPADVEKQMEFVELYGDRQKMLQCDQLIFDKACESGLTAECPICMTSDYPVILMGQCVDGHLFCRGCMHECAKNAAFGEAKLVCMQPECDKPFIRRTLLLTIPKPLLRKAEERSRDEQLQQALDDESKERCKFCQTIFEVEPDPNNRVITCPLCKGQYCRQCRNDWEVHFGLRCIEVENDTEMQARKRAEEAMTSAIVRQCKRCKKEIMKEEGCNKMVCTCGAKFCYVCNEEILLPNPYQHFCQHFREVPGAACKKCDKCLLWEKTDSKDQQKINEIESKKNEELQNLRQKRAADYNAEMQLGQQQSKLARVDNPGSSSELQNVGFRAFFHAPRARSSTDDLINI